MLFADRMIQYSLLAYAFVSCISIALSNICIGMATLGALIYWIQTRRLPLNADPRLIQAIFLFIGSIFLSAIFSPDHSNSFNKLWAYFYRTFPLFLVVFFIKDNKFLFRAFLGVLLSITISDSYAIWQGFHGNFRAAAFSSHPMIFAGYLVQVLGIQLMLMIATGHNFKKYKILAWASLGLSLIALLFNGTRGAWFAMGLILAIVSFYKVPKKKYWFLGCLIALVIFATLFFTVPGLHARFLTLTDPSYQSNSERVLLWKSAWQMFLDHPFVGIGVGQFFTSYTTQYISPLAVERQVGHAHNNFLQMLADAGLVGLIFFLYLFYTIIRLSYQNYKKTESPYSLAFLFATAGLLLQGLTEFNFGDSAVIRLYWFLTGIAFHSAFFTRKEEENGSL